MLTPKFYIRQHELLGILISKTKDNRKVESISAKEISFTKDELSEKMGITVSELEDLVQPLRATKDIMYHYEKDAIYIYAGENSATSYYYRQILEKGRKYVIEKFFDYLKIISGVILLLIALITFVINIVDTNNNKTRIKELEKKMQENMDSVRAIKGHLK